MTLSDILNTTKLSANELTKKIAFRSLRNSIDDCLSMYKRNFMSVIEDTIKGIANGSLYNSGCYNPNKPMSEISDEDKKDLIKKVKEQSEKTLNNFKDTVEEFGDLKAVDKSEKKEIEVNLQVQKVEDTPTATAAVAPVSVAPENNYFRY